MEKRVRVVVKIGVVIVLTLMIGVGAVYAVNQQASTVTPDSVAVLKSQDVTCGSCAGRIENALRGKSGVAAVEVDVEAGKITVAFDSKITKAEALAETVTVAGYGSSILQVMPVEQYKPLTVANPAQQPAKSGGCGCCNKNRN